MDLGLNNVGWAVVDKSGAEPELLDQGTYVFSSPLEEDQDASSGLKSKDRGMKRRSRRTLHRRAQRKRNLYHLLAKNGFLPMRMDERVTFFCRNKIDGREVNPYALRARAIRERLEPFEIGRVLCHLNQRRGFLSPRELMLMGVAKPDEAYDAPLDEKEGPIKQEIRQTKDAMQGFPTLGAFLYDRMTSGEPVRKKVRGATDAEKKAENARRFVRHDRALIEQEFDAIWAAQAKYHPLLTDNLCEQVHTQVFRQIPIGKQIGLRGKCTFFPEETRIARASLTTQKFLLAQDIANLKFSSPSQPEPQALSEKQRKALLQELNRHDQLTWAEVKNAVGLGPTAQFNVEPPPGRTQAKGSKKFLVGNRTAIELRKLLGDKWDALGELGQRTLVGEMLTVPDDPKNRGSHKEIRTAAKKLFDILQSKPYGPNGVTFTQTEAANLATIDLPAGYLNLSLKAVKKLTPSLLKDCTYDQACARVGLDHANPDETGEVFDRLKPEFAEAIRHPLVRCSVLSAIRVINQIIDRYGKPSGIHIELPRDLARSAKQREEVEKEQREREKIRNGYRKLIEEAGFPVNDTNLKKVDLWHEAGKVLPYEPDVTISTVKELLAADIEIDHIVPRSHNFDNSRGNLALCTRDFNIRIKRNGTLYAGVMAYDPGRWAQIEAHVRSIKTMSPAKRDRILAKTLPDKDFMGRHFSSTGYISSEVLRIVRKLWVEDVVVTNGSITGELRRRWGLNKVVPLHPEEIDENGKPKKTKSRSNYRHHALDAVVIALTDRSLGLAVTKYYQEYERTGIRPESGFPCPIPAMRHWTAGTIADWPVVHRPDRRASGAMHNETAYAVPPGTPEGKPFTSQVVGNKLIRYDREGKPAQAYALSNNHHVVIWERTTPNKKGEFERCAEVVPTIEAVRRRQRKDSVVRTHRVEPGWRFVMALCKGDMVEMEDGTIGVVSKFSAKQKPCDAELAIWAPYAALKLGKVNKDNGYIVAYIQTAGRLAEVRRRVVLNAFGDVVWSEGGEG